MYYLKLFKSLVILWSGSTFFRQLPYGQLHIVHPFRKLLYPILYSIKTSNNYNIHVQYLQIFQQNCKKWSKCIL